MTVAYVQEINPRVRLVWLHLPHPISFLPGQWLDVHVPSVPQTGGFTITSTPRAASQHPYGGPPHNPDHFYEDGILETKQPTIRLAIGKAPGNPPAAWLWRDVSEIQCRTIQVRVGGRFVWPPVSHEFLAWERVVMVAGGVGIK